jgi:cob(I)alamin adenosyltransferase
MSIVSRQGDRGETRLMHGRRVRKTHPRVEACGAVDELNCALGLVRAMAGAGGFGEQVQAIQRELIILMGELATLPEDLPARVKGRRAGISVRRTRKLEALITGLERRAFGQRRGWALPGASAGGAVLHLARAVCRRAERRVCALDDAGQLGNREILVYLNRLSDLLWLMAAELDAGGRRGSARTARA